ncbi:MAG TPA: hypothetical protein VI603_19020 [Saprospiraceae bacterium]|nr:hypothetical protein [Saprospiraceae bacterium]
MKLLVIITVIIYTLNSSCTKQRPMILGHWYLTNIDGRSMYIELNFVDSDSVFIAHDGQFWYKTNYEIIEDSLLILGSNRSEILMLHADSLKLRIDEYQIVTFLRLNDSTCSIDSADAMVFRRFKYYATNLDESDTSGIEDLKYEMWNYFNGRVNEIVNDDIRIEKKQK